MAQSSNEGEKTAGPGGFIKAASSGARLINRGEEINEELVACC